MYNIIKIILDYMENIKCYCKNNECNCFIFKSIVRKNHKKCCRSSDSFKSNASND